MDCNVKAIYGTVGHISEDTVRRYIQEQKK